MLFERLCREESLAARRTHEGPLSSVTAHVYTEFGLAGVLPVTQRTVERAVDVQMWMCSSQVLVELVRFGEQFAAMRTPVRILTCVSLHVLAQVGGVLESDVTY